MRLTIESIYLSRTDSFRGDNYKMIVTFLVPEGCQEQCNNVCEKLKKYIGETKIRKYKLFSENKLEITMYILDSNEKMMQNVFEIRYPGDVIINLGMGEEFLSDWSSIFLNDVNFLTEDMYEKVIKMFRKRHIASER